VRPSICVSSPSCPRACMLPVFIRSMLDMLSFRSGARTIQTYTHLTSNRIRHSVSTNNWICWLSVVCYSHVCLCVCVSRTLIQVPQLGLENSFFCEGRTKHMSAAMLWHELIIQHKK
jgi:hypothetical protein